MTDSTGSGVNPFTSFLLGRGMTSVSYINSPRPATDVYNWETGYFFQEDWKVTPGSRSILECATN